MDRHYTVRLLITRTYGRKVNKSDKLSEITRAVSRALPDGWRLEAGAIQLRSDSEGAKRKRAKRAAQSKAEVAARRKQAAKERRERAESVRRSKAWAKETWVSPGFGEEDTAWIMGVLKAEKMNGWKVYGDLKPTLTCWTAVTQKTASGNPTLARSAKRIDIDMRSSSTMLTVLGARAEDYLRKNLCAVSVVPRVRMALLHEVAHYRRWRAKDGAAGHDRRWQLALLNLLRKHVPEAFTIEAVTMDALRELK